MEPKDKLLGLLNEIVTGKISVADFSSQYEHIWNFELTEEFLTKLESELFEKMFDVAVWYSEFEDDRKEYPGYTNEDDVINAAKETLAKIAQEK